MNFLSIFTLSLGLAMDATAVAAARGLASAKIEAREALGVGLLFGGFHALMPTLGWLMGSRVGPLIAAFDHWVAFVILAVIGGNMLLKGTRGHAPTHETIPQENSIQVLLTLGFATSLDSFAVGVTLPLLDAPIALSILTLGLTAGALSVVGLFAGRQFGATFGKRLDALGGLVLIFFGAKLLVEHLHGGR